MKPKLKDTAPIIISVLILFILTIAAPIALLIFIVSQNLDMSVLVEFTVRGGRGSGNIQVPLWSVVVGICLWLILGIISTYYRFRTAYDQLKK